VTVHLVREVVRPDSSTLAAGDCILIREVSAINVTCCNPGRQVRRSVRE